jgi:hypothetical protein
MIEMIPSTNTALFEGVFGPLKKIFLLSGPDWRLCDHYNEIRFRRLRIFIAAKDTLLAQLSWQSRAAQTREATIPREVASSFLAE